VEVAVVIVGDEILSGHVRDGNTHFVAARLAELGHRLARASIVGDEPAMIAVEIERARAEGVGLAVVCGGLGSTHDDRTMEGVAAALRRPLEVCPPIQEGIERVIASAEQAGFSAEAFGAAAMRKMALAPAGAEALTCSVPFIPAFAIDDDGFSVVVLPGPPNQLARVFTEAVEPRYLAGTGSPVHRVEITHRFPESTFAALLAELTERFPSSAIGSYPQRDHTLVRIAGLLEEAEAIGRELRAAIEAVAASEEGQRFLRYVTSRRGSRP
jgi:nicotinamide-nucleotide amidase